MYNDNYRYGPVYVRKHVLQTATDFHLEYHSYWMYNKTEDGLDPE